uniref:Endonuclease/exonuclease/phosphatase domain-containing protein n=1 Tax=Brassica campestris TaxID=3711 RepID=A0A3P5ZTC5_BRACM|nr:unnamed protein product [Brassica rapa]
MWGKGKRLEMHNNPLNRSTLVRIPSEYLRSKILDKSQWSSEHSMSTPPLRAIKIWAHLTGVPLDLRYNKGLSLVAGLIGEPKETDDFTRNLVSLTVSHVKVEVDLTKPLPDVVEFERQNGEVVESNPPTAPTTTDPQPPSLVNPNIISSTSPLHLLPVSPPCPRPSLKRSRSSPTFSPTLPSNSNPNPFTPLPSDPIKSLPFPAFSQPPATSVPPNTLLLCTNNWLHSHKPLFGAILESHVKELSLPPLMSKLCPAWHYTSNHQSDEDGRIVLIWKDPLKLQIVHQSWQSITCLISIPNKDPFYYTAIYASNLVVDRSDLWTELLHLHSTFDMDNNVWFVGGDFNQIQHHSEHSSSSVSSNDHQMYLLQDCFLQLGIFDLRYNGPSHTWSNNRPEDPILEKSFDRLLVNRESRSLIPHALPTFLPPLSRTIPLPP